MPFQFRALISSDWNECLAPCGPFDAIGFNFPHLKQELETVFRRYTGNQISLGEAAKKISASIPKPLSQDLVDDYIDKGFQTYRGVSELIRWAAKARVLFMINTTGMIGYFQRLFARGLLPKVSVLAAHPLVRFASAPTDPPTVFALSEITDKAVYTESVARRQGLSFSRIAVIGDSGGDGPHFAWAAEKKAIRVASMTKASLTHFCTENRIRFDRQFGLSYDTGETPDRAAEMAFDFQELIPFFEEKLL